MAATKTKKKPAARAGSRSSSNGTGSKKKAAKAVAKTAGKSTALAKRPVKSARTMRRVARFAKEAGPAVRHGGQAALDVARRVRDLVEGRRGALPLQAAIDIAMPISAVYDAWLELEELPGTGNDDVEITEERTDERIAWSNEEVEAIATFHLLDDRLTRVELLIDGGPSGPLARRRVNNELLRIKAYMELEVEEQYEEDVE
jgi:uncharacterized membrane protein